MSERPLSSKQDMLTEAAILDALRDCYDPELHCNIVDLGLVYRIAIAPDPDAPGAGIPGVPTRHRVAIDLTLTAPEDPAQPELATETADQITAQIQNRLGAFETISRTEVALVWHPPWTPNRISPEGRKRLSFDARPKPSPLVQIEVSAGPNPAAREKLRSQ
jgi:metal-sulfur cluster biosynthetic enzyme